VNSMSTYDRINLVRKERGITWNALNLKVDGAYHGRMTDLKHGKTTLSNSQLQAVSDILGTTLNFLLGNTDDPAPPGQKEQPTPASESELSPLDKRLNELLALASDDTKRLMIDLLERMQNQ